MKARSRDARADRRRCDDDHTRSAGDGCNLASMPSAAQVEARSRSFSREIGCVRGAEPGPTLIVVGGIHGNEPAGVIAAERVLAKLAPSDVRGELALLAGNVGALRQHKRYVAKDLNRQWGDARIAETRKKREHDAEDREQLELLEAIEGAMARARGDVFVLDLHTTSAAGIPFVLFGDSLRQRAFGFEFPLPIVLGLEEQVDGVLSSGLTERGCVAVAIEGGQHDDPSSIDNLEACIWIGLASGGLIEKDARYERAYRLLEARRGDLPRVMEVTERHAIAPEDAFQMAPGFANLDRAKRGQLLATDRRGEIRAPRDVLVILPLYQGLGSDGFFWGRALSERVLAISAALRRAGAARLLPLLPGVRRDEDEPSRLCAGPTAARIYARGLFHLLGHRRIRSTDGGGLTIGPASR
jgi:predicted deacylase